MTSPGLPDTPRIGPDAAITCATPALSYATDAGRIRPDHGFATR
jgi:hypothetical protein